MPDWVSPLYSLSISNQPKPKAIGSRPMGLPLAGATSPYFRGESSPPERRDLRRVAPMQWTVRQFEYGMRLLANQVVGWRNRHAIEQVHSVFSKLDTQSPDYIVSLLAAGYLNAQQAPLQLEMNLEDNPFEDIVARNESCVFMMNHDFQFYDPALLSYFGLMLYQAYFQAGKSATCPRPAILMNEDILKAMPDKLREIYEKMGAVGVDASVTHTRGSTRTNSSVLKPLLTDLVKNKRHLFIFPEGRMAGRHDLDMKDRFQDGIADMVMIAANRKGRLDVVPVGFALNKRKKVANPLYDPNEKLSPKKLKLASIYVGKPVVFQVSKQGEMSVNTANMTPENAPDSYRQFFFRLEPKEKPLKPGRLHRLGTAVGRLNPISWWRGTGQSSSTGQALPPVSSLPVSPEVLQQLGFVDVNGVISKTLTDKGVPVPLRHTTPYIKDVLEENLRICREKAIAALPQSVELEPIAVGVLQSTSTGQALSR